MHGRVNIIQAGGIISFVGTVYFIANRFAAGSEIKALGTAVTLVRTPLQIATRFQPFDNARDVAFVAQQTVARRLATTCTYTQRGGGVTTERL